MLTKVLQALHGRTPDLVVPIASAKLHFDAFISYSQAMDEQLGPLLRAGLQVFARPWYRRRALAVFLDRASLSANPNLWGSIQAALHESRYLVLLASSGAARSYWVNREVEEWLKFNTAERVLIVLTEGSIRWSPERGDFDPDSTDSLPPALFESYDAEPNIVDLRWARRADDLSLRNPQFASAVCELAAPIHGMRKDELLGDDVQQHRRRRRLVGATIAVLLVLLLASAILGVISESRRGAAESRELAARSRLAEDLAEALQFALLADRRQANDDTRGALLDALMRHPRVDRVYQGAASNVSSLALLGNTGRRLYGAGDTLIRVWDEGTGRPLDSIELPGRNDIHFELDAAGQVAFILDASGRLEVLTVDSGGSLQGTPAIAAFDGVDKFIKTLRGDLLLLFKDQRLGLVPRGGTLARLPFDNVVAIAEAVQDGHTVLALAQTTGSGHSVRLAEDKTRPPFALSRTACDEVMDLAVLSAPKGLLVACSIKTQQQGYSRISSSVRTYLLRANADRWSVESGPALGDGAMRPTITPLADGLVARYLADDGYSYVTRWWLRDGEWEYEHLMQARPFFTAQHLAPDGQSLFVATVLGEVYRVRLDRYNVQSNSTVQNVNAQLVGYDAVGDQCMLAVTWPTMVEVRECSSEASVRRSVSTTANCEGDWTRTADSRHLARPCDENRIEWVDPFLGHRAMYCCGAFDGHRVVRHPVSGQLLVANDKVISALALDGSGVERVPIWKHAGEIAGLWLDSKQDRLIFGDRRGCLNELPLKPHSALRSRCGLMREVVGGVTAIPAPDRLVVEGRDRRYGYRLVDSLTLEPRTGLLGRSSGPTMLMVLAAASDELVVLSLGGFGSRRAGSASMTLEVWNLATGQPIGSGVPLLGLAGRDLKVSPSGREIALIDGEGALLRLRLGQDDLRMAVERVLGFGADVVPQRR